MTKERLYQSVARDLIEAIERGEFPPGTRLPGERELADRFDVSRVTIREAEIALEALGYIEIKTGSGVYVRQRAAAGPDALPDVSAFELTAARAVIEAEAAALAAANMTEAGILELEALVDAMSDAERNADDDGEDVDRKFHMTIARLSGNPVIEHTVATLWRIRAEGARVREVYAGVCAKDAEARTDEHAAILNALRRRDPVGSRLAMREHFQRLFEAMLVATETQAMAELKQRLGEDRQRFLVTTQI
jgi:GntR family transcriptional regulator, transcriptional repressor for pyruvate dehydrogenase complex